MKLLEGILAAVGGDDGGTRRLEDLAGERKRILIIVHDQNLDAVQFWNLQLLSLRLGVTG